VGAGSVVVVVDDPGAAVSGGDDDDDDPHPVTTHVVASRERAVRTTEVRMAAPISGAQRRTPLDTTVRRAVHMASTALVDVLQT
jgi:hypothetical protein